MNMNSIYEAEFMLWLVIVMQTFALSYIIVTLFDLNVQHDIFQLGLCRLKKNAKGKYKRCIPYNQHVSDELALKVLKENVMEELDNYRAEIEINK